MFWFLEILKADENRLYERMTALLNEDETFINIPGMYPISILILYLS